MSMASILNSRKIKSGTKSLRIKSSSLEGRSYRISSPSKSIEVEKIIMHDGFCYFPIDK
jgi:hypothetical protein